MPPPTVHTPSGEGLGGPVIIPVMLATLPVSSNHAKTTAKQWPIWPILLPSTVFTSRFQPIPGLISCAGGTRNVGITRHACATTQMAGLSHTIGSLVALVHHFDFHFKLSSEQLTLP